METKICSFVYRHVFILFKEFFRLLLQQQHVIQQEIEQNSIEPELYDNMIIHMEDENLNNENVDIRHQLLQYFER